MMSRLMFPNRHNRVLRRADERPFGPFIAVATPRRFPGRTCSGWCWGKKSVLLLLDFPQAIRSNPFLSGRAAIRQQLLKMVFRRLEVVPLQGFIPQANFFSHDSSSVNSNHISCIIPHPSFTA
jgi:hypothetical protein